MTTEKMIDVYECFFYYRYGEKGMQMCKYYPDFCNKCEEPIKVGTITVSESKEVGNEKLLLL